MKPMLAFLVLASLTPAPSALASARRHSLFGGSGSYTNSGGRQVRSPKRSLLGAAFGSSAKCRDGTSSFSRRASGSCSGHGGVARFR